MTWYHLKSLRESNTSARSYWDIKEWSLELCCVTYGIWYLIQITCIYFIPTLVTWSKTSVFMDLVKFTVLRICYKLWTFFLLTLYDINFHNLMKTDSVDWIYNEIHKKNVFNKYWWNHQITCSKLSYFFVTVHKSMIAEWDYICKALQKYI